MMIRNLVCGALAALLCAAPAWAQDESSSTAEQSPRFALLIGIKTYNGPQAPPLPDLANPCNDIEAVQAKLIQSGWKEDDVVVRCDLAIESVNGELSRFLSRFELADQPTALLYFSGHGVQVDKESYFFGKAAKPDVGAQARLRSRNPRAALFSAEATDVARFVSNQVGDVHVNQGALLVVLDACRDNPLLGMVKRHLANVTAPKPFRVPHGVMVVYSTSDGDTASDGPGSLSPFADAFVKSIHDGETFDDVVNEATDIVVRATAGQPWEQVPSKTGTLVPPKRCFRGCPQAAPAAEPESPVSEGLHAARSFFRLASFAGQPAAAVRPAEVVKTPSKAARTRVVYERKAEKTDETPKINFDVYFCDGDAFAESRRLAATEMAQAAATYARLAQSVDGTVLGRIRVRALSPEVNNDPNYQLNGNYILYNERDPLEDRWTKKLQEIAPSPFKALVNPQGTPNYLSAFVCSDVSLDRQPARVFFQTARASQEKVALQLMGAIEKNVQGVSVASAIDLQEDNSPDTSEVRYYYEADKKAAVATARLLSTELHKSVGAKDFRSLQRKVRPGTMEVWLGKDVQPQQ